MIEGVCENIERVFVDFYADLFTSSNPLDFFEIIEAVQPKVTEAMNVRLTREFQAEEVYRALKQMYSLKALGLDGMPPIFFQHFWLVVGRIVNKTVLDFLNLGITPSKFNDTHVVLIPKTKNLRKVTEYRLISLCNMVYKLA